jgi:hypothetical protein
MAKWKFDYQAHMQDKYEQVLSDLQSRYLQEVEGKRRREMEKRGEGKR